MSEGTEENHENLNQDNQCSGRDSKRVPPEHESTTLPPRQTTRKPLVYRASTPVYYTNCQTVILDMSIAVAIYCLKICSSSNSIGKLNTNSVKVQHTAKETINWTLNRITVSSLNRHHGNRNSDVTSCNAIEVYRSFGRKYPPSSVSKSKPSKQPPRNKQQRWRQSVTPKRRYTSTRLHSVTTQKRVLFAAT
jgi:hypothetical protein